MLGSVGAPPGNRRGQPTSPGSPDLSVYEDLRLAGCDASAAVAALRLGYHAALVPSEANISQAGGAPLRRLPAR